MLNTLIRLGKQLSEGRGEWDDIIDFPHAKGEYDGFKHIITSQAVSLKQNHKTFFAKNIQSRKE